MIDTPRVPFSTRPAREAAPTPAVRPVVPMAGSSRWWGSVSLATALMLAACGGGGGGAADAGAAAGSDRKTAQAASVAVGAVIINEVMTANWQGDVDEDGDAKDWVELHNPGNQAVDLTGFGLSNKVKSPFRWVFPSGVTIAPGQYLRVWLSQKDRAVAGAPLHTSFNLDNGADPLVLTAPDGSVPGLVLDSTTAPLMHADTSWCRQPGGDAAAPFVHCATPSAGAANAGQSDAALLATPTLSVGSGFYAAAQSVTLNGPAGAEIRYTLDGSEPTAASPLYSAPLTIAQNTVLRTAAFAAGRLGSLVETANYLIGADAAAKYAGQRVIFVSLPPADVARFQAADKTLVARASVEMFAADRTRLFKATAEADVGGQEGSLLWPQRSMDISFKDALGTKSVKAAVFPEKPGVTTLKKFRLRNGGNDWPLTHLRDQFTQSLASESGNVYASAGSVALVINGRYYGLADLREKEVETLIEGNYGVDKDNVDFIADPLLPAQEVKNGANALASYQAMHDFVTRNDMSLAANYARARTLLNVESLAQDWALHLYAVQRDWPHRNVHVWRSPEIDGRWNWQPHDMDWTWGLRATVDVPATNMYDLLAVQGSELMQALLRNTEFRQLFINIIADQANSTLAPTYAKARLDTMAAEMRPYVAAYRAAYSEVQGDWEQNLGAIKTFLDARGAFHDTHTRAYFGLSARQNVAIGVNDPAMGTVKINTLDLGRWISAAATPWVGAYYPEVPVTLEARPKPGYVFVGWQGASTSTARTISHTPRAEAGFTAVFAAAGAVAAPVISAIPAQGSLTGDLVDLPLAASDPAGLPLTFSAKGLPSGLAMYAGNGRIYGRVTTPGTYSATVTVSNGKTSATGTIAWVVTDRPHPATPPDNQAPTLASPGAQSSRVGVAVSLQLVGTDPEGGALRYGAAGLPAGLSLAAETGLITGVPTAAGNSTTSITVQDGAGAQTAVSFAWTVVAANQAPSVSAPGAQSSTVGQAVSLAVQGSDPEGAALSWSATGLPAGLSIDAATGVIRGAPTSAGTATVSLTVRDPEGASATAGFVWTVLPLVVNQPPVLVRPADASSTVGQAIDLTVQGSDPEGGPLVFLATGLPPGVGMTSNTGRIQGVTTTAGSHVVTVTLQDVQGLRVATTFNWVVRAVVNQPPVLTSPGAQTHRVGTALTLALGARDPEGDALTFTASGLPAGLAISPAGVITGTPTTAGTHGVTLVVRDAGGASSSAVFTWTVLANVANGSFESPVLRSGSFDAGGPITSWTVGSSALLSTAGSTYTSKAPGPVDGLQVLGLRNAATASQTLVLLPGDSLRLRATQRVNVRTGLQSIGVYLNGVKQGASLTAASGSWTSFVVPLSVAAKGSFRLELRGLTSGWFEDRTAFVDKVEIVPAAALSAVPNGSFEAPVIGAGKFAYAPGGATWAFTGSAGIAGTASGFTASAPAPVQGAQVAFVQNGGRLSQSLTLGAGQNLRLRATQRVNWGTGNQSLAVFVNGVQKGGTYTPASGSWSSFDVPLGLAAAGTVTVEIRGLISGSGQDRTAFVDAVEIVR